MINTGHPEILSLRMASRASGLRLPLLKRLWAKYKTKLYTYKRPRKRCYFCQDILQRGKRLTVVQRPKKLMEVHEQCWSLEFNWGLGPWDALGPSGLRSYMDTYLSGQRSPWCERADWPYKVRSKFVVQQIQGVV